jgi:hypothetical protein
VPAEFENFFEDVGIAFSDEKSFTAPFSPHDIARFEDVSRKNDIFYVPTLK